jgi:hypothetical protein
VSWVLRRIFQTKNDEKTETGENSMMRNFRDLLVVKYD